MNRTESKNCPIEIRYFVAKYLLFDRDEKIHPRLTSLIHEQKSRHKKENTINNRKVLEEKKNGSFSARGGTQRI